MCDCKTDPHFLLEQHGAKLARGSERQRDRVTKEQIQQDMEKYDKVARSNDAQPCVAADSCQRPSSTGSCG